MSISIQGSTAVMTALEALTQGGASAGGIPAGLLNPSGDQAQGADPSSILDLTGGAAAAALGGLTGGLANSASLADAALSAGTAVQTLLGQMQAAAQGASDPGLSADERTTLDASFQADLTKIQTTVANASVGGTNLLDGSLTAAPDGPATLTPVNLTAAGPLIGLSTGASLNDPTSAATISAKLQTALSSVGQALEQLTQQSNAVQGHLTLVSQAALSLSPSLASSVNPDLDSDGARLQALSVSQTLMGSGSSMANQGSTAILALFQ